jgi:hypothetical protein
MNSSSIRSVLRQSDDYKPSITFDVKELPEIKDWKIGGKYKLLLDVEEVSMSKDEYEPRLTARFKVMKVKVAK